jgi:predicted RNA-binding protein YlqC (UPF0109 family)
MNDSSFLEFLLLPVIKDKNLFTVDIIECPEKNSLKISLRVSPGDMKKIIGYGGKVYRSLRTLLRHKIGNSSVELLVDIIHKKSE